MDHSFFAFGLPHGADYLYILIGIVILFGADKLPKLARGLGKSLGEFKKAKEDFEKEMHSAAAEPEAKKLDDKPALTVTPAPTATPVDVLTKKN